MAKSPYDVLGVRQNASQDEIKTAYRKLVKQMYDRLAEAHPILSEAMIFVNRDEDPALTRLAAERYTQHKLQQLEPKEK